MKNTSLPKGWVWTSLGEVCSDPQYGWTTSAADDGKLHLLRTTDITSGNIDWESVPFCKEAPVEKEKYLLKTGDIVISRAGSVGYSYLIRSLKEAVFASYLIRFRPLIDEYYLSFFLKSPSYWKSISEKSLGIAIPNVNASKLKQIRVPLPPLPEQHRIVAKIEELFTRLDAGVEALRKVKAEIKRYRQAVLKHAFEGRLTEEWRAAHKGELEPASVLLARVKEERKKNAKGKFKELPPVDASELPSLPEGWVWAMLPQLGDLNRGKSKHRPRDDKRLYGGKYPFIQTGDVRNSNGIIESYSQTYNEFGLQQSKLWSEGTLCITIAANIAETAILGISACFPDSIVGFIADAQISKTKYVYFFIKAVKNKLEAYAPATAQKNINLNTLNNLIIPLPPLSEQHKIVEEIERHFSIADGVESDIDQSLKQAERLRQSILKRAFEGKLVPQDPTDEPAEKLLEKIKAEKVKQEMNKKAFKKSSKQKELR